MRRIYIDTNVLYLVLRRPDPSSGLLPWLDQVISRLGRGEEHAVISPLVLDEIYYRLLIAAARDGGDPRPMRRLREEPESLLRRYGASVSRQVDAIIALPNIEIVPVDAAVWREAMRIATAHALLPRDALHVATARSSGCKAIVSLDNDFSRSTALLPWEGPPVAVPAPAH